MAFPQSVLPVRVRIAPSGKPAADPSTWVWVDVTSYVRVASGIVIEEGRPDEAAKVDPSKCTLTVDNRDGRFSSRNVLGPYYGKIGKGTPIRVGTVAIADTFTRTTSNGWGTTESGPVWTTTGTTSDWSVSPSGGAQVLVQAANTIRLALVVATELLDIDAKTTFAMPAVMTGANFVAGILLRYVDPNNYYVLSCEFTTAGTLSARLRRNLAGVQTDIANLATVPGVTYTAGTKITVRVQADGPALRLKIWAAAGAEPDAWTLTGTDSTILDAGLFGYYLWTVAGNTNTKPMAVTVDDVEVESIEYTGAVRKWPPRWDKSRRDATVTITAAGILSRLQQATSALRSPIDRMFQRNKPVAAWIMDDNDGATTGAASVAKVAPATARAVEFGQATPLLYGAKQTAGITASSVLTGRIPGHSNTGTWGFVWFAQLLAPPAAITRIMTITATGTIRTWAIELDATSFWVRGYDSDGTQIVSNNTLYPLDAIPPRWVAYDLVIDQNGGNIDIQFIQYGITGDTSNPFMSVTSISTAGTIGSPTGWKVEGSLGYNGGRLGPVAAFNAEPPFVTYAFANAANGYNGEAAADRIARLCAEEGVQVVVEPGVSEKLGPQRTDTFLKLLYSAEEADLGILYERGAGLAYRPRGARYNRPVELVFDFDPGDVAESPEPDDDDLGYKNRVVVSRDAGSSATAENPELIEANGLAEETITINVAGDSVLADHANFRLELQSPDEYRWPLVVLNLARNTAQIRSWRAAKPFPRMTIANEPSQVAGNDVDVIVLGHAQTLGPYGWDIALNCSPASPWNVAVYGAKKYGSGSCTTNSTLTNATGTGVSLTLKVNTPKDTWSTTAVPYPILVNGEVMTVTAMAAASGTAPTITQVATVTRAVNGIAIAHAVGEAVQLQPRPRYAL